MSHITFMLCQFAIMKDFKISLPTSQNENVCHCDFLFFIESKCLYKRQKYYTFRGARWISKPYNLCCGTVP